MEITENKLYEALGLEAPVQEPTAHADPTPAVSTQEGENAQEPAAPAPEGNDPAPADEQAATGAESAQDGPKSLEGLGPGEGGKPVQTEQERRENAARRRRAEQQAAIDAAVQAERDRSKAEWDAFFAGAQLKNTLTGELITNKEQYQAWQQAFAADKLQRELAAGKLTPEGLNQAISNNPTVKKAMEIVERSETEEAQRKETAARAQIEAELAEIRKYDLTIQDVKDFLKMPNFLEFKDYVDRGYRFRDAYILANQDQIQAKQAEAARQQAMNNTRSKDHLTGTSVRGTGAASVPAGELAMYRLFNPEATEAQIQAHYNANKPKT